ncbi:MAG TPA: hypothetical protein VK656_00695 [Candidatus Acidoferrum sp.]|nr:hypothetical protein [Candidatus Acidoferrum sp.]
MTTEPRAFFTLDLGAATTAAALIGRIDGRWHLLGSTASPAGIEPDAVLTSLGRRVLAADPLLGPAIGVAGDDDPTTWPRLVSRSSVPPRLTVIAATETTRDRLEMTAEAAGWDVTGGSLEDDEVLELVRAGLEPGRATILAGTADPPNGPERGRGRALSDLVDALGSRLPDGALVLAGGLAVSRSATPDGSGGRDGEAMPVTRAGAPGAERLFAPAAGSWNGQVPGDDPLRAFLERLRAMTDEATTASVRATASLAAVLERRVEVVSVGLDGGLRVAAWPPPPAEPDGPDQPRHVTVRAALVPTAGLVPEILDDDYVDEVMAWSTIPFDRIRLRDRLSELRRAPWGDPDGDGAALRLAAARAAIGRLVEATPSFLDLPAPDLIVAAGGAFCAAPGPAVALALADMLRRPGACGLALDHARLLGPLGTIPDEAERRAMIADLADELLAPLGSVIIPQGMHAGRSAGRVTVHGGTGSTDLDLVPGGLQLVDLPPGQVATAEFEFRDTVRLGTRGRHFAVEVAGGLGGLLLDLRDIPLRMPERLEHRRELLAAWQGALWTGADR